MQTLGLSDSTPRTESRLKSLFWPSIQNRADIDYVATQGYWICAVVAILSFLFNVLGGHPVVGILLLLFYYLGGVGIRVSNRYAAAVVFGIYALDLLAIPLAAPAMLITPGIVLRLCFTALLLANVRGTWLVARLKSSEDEQASYLPVAESWSDKFVDKFPVWLWPRLRLTFYVFSALLIVFTSVGLISVVLLRLR